MPNVVSFTAPLLAAGTASSAPLQVSRALNITGTVFADQAGTAFVDQSGDGINWDLTTSISVSANTGTQIDVELINQFYRVRYTNGGSAQTIFRLFVNPRDPYGAFLAAALPPSAGGAFAVLFFSPAASDYTYVGRFDGLDGYNAIMNAALSKGESGKYAALVVADAVVSDETIISSTQHNPDAF